MPLLLIGTPIHWIIIFFYFLWLIATVINQFNYPWVQKTLSFDVFHLLPRWTFFAPNPGTSDYHVLYRQMDKDKNISKFIEIPLHGKRKISSFIWNPHKRVKKTLLDLAMTMNRQISFPEINENNIKLSFSYIAFLNFLSSVPKNSDTESIQFIILMSNGFKDKGEPNLIICSEFHNV